MPNYTRKATTCSVSGCEAGGYMTRGLCKMHYARLRRRGSVGGAEKQHASAYAGQQCSVPGCEGNAHSLGLCKAHYKRQRRWGDPQGQRPITDPVERFWSKVDKAGTIPSARPGLGACWVWTAGSNGTGYGAFHPARGVTVLAHRWVYEQEIGPIDPLMVVDHLCRNRACVNPWHLEQVTNEENLRRGAGYALRNGMRNACIHGHEYTPENTYTCPKGKIRCRACAAENDKKRKRDKDGQ